MLMRTKIRIPYEKCENWISASEFRKSSGVSGKWTVQNGDFFMIGRWTGENVSGIDEIRKNAVGIVGKVLNHSENFFGGSKHIRIGGDLNGARIRMQIDPADKILLKRSLNKNGEGQRFFTHEVRRLSDPYVPKRSGKLKDTAVETKTSITYNTPYARRQYYEHKGDGLRGSHWTERMWADRGKEIVRSVAAFCGGKTK